MGDLHYLIWAGLAAAMVGLSKGGLPTVGMLSVPILSLFMSPVKAVVILLPIYIISDLVGLWLYRKDFSAINLKVLVPAGVGGVLVGWLTASLVSDTAVKMMIGLLGVGFVLNAWRKRNAAQTPRPASWRQGLLELHLARGWTAVSGLPLAPEIVQSGVCRYIDLVFCRHQSGQAGAIPPAAALRHR